MLRRFALSLAVLALAVTPVASAAHKTTAVEPVTDPIESPLPSPCWEPLFGGSDLDGFGLVPVCPAPGPVGS